VKVPVIVVFTKYDRLIDQVDFELGPSGNGLSDDAIKELVRERAETKLQEVCIKPLEEFAGSDIPHAAISSEYRCSGRLVCAQLISERS
jgi:hypothetical protein